MSGKGHRKAIPRCLSAPSGIQDGGLSPVVNAIAAQAGTRGAELPANLGSCATFAGGRAEVYNIANKNKNEG